MIQYGPLMPSQKSSRYYSLALCGAARSGSNAHTAAHIARRRAMQPPTPSTACKAASLGRAVAAQRYVASLQRGSPRPLRRPLCCGEPRGQRAQEPARQPPCAVGSPRGRPAAFSSVLARWSARSPPGARGLAASADGGRSAAKRRLRIHA